MTEEEVIKLSIKLRKKIYNEIVKFWDENKKVTHQNQFFINSVTSASIVAQLTHIMFRKDIGHEAPFMYIDGVCKAAKEQYVDGSQMMSFSKCEH